MGTDEPGISRRDVIKKGAAAGAILWAAPVVESFVSRAAAASVTCTPCSSSGGFTYSYASIVFMIGSNVYVVKISGNSCSGDNGTSGDIAGLVNVSCNGVTYTNPGGTLEANGTPITPYPSSCPFTFGGTSGHDVCVNNGSGVTVLFAVGHDGSFTNHFETICPSTSPPACKVSF